MDFIVFSKLGYILPLFIQVLFPVFPLSLLFNGLQLHIYHLTGRWSCVYFFSLFIFCASVWMVSIAMSSQPLILSPLEVSNLLLNPFSVFFISKNFIGIFHTFHLSSSHINVPLCLLDIWSIFVIVVLVSLAANFISLSVWVYFYWLTFPPVLGQVLLTLGMS